MALLTFSGQGGEGGLQIRGLSIYHPTRAPFSFYLKSTYSELCLKVYYSPSESNLPTHLIHIYIHSLYCCFGFLEDMK